MKVTELNTVLGTIEYAGEKFINLLELEELLEDEIVLEMDEVIITPYYIQNDKRLELYQYEFCCMKNCNFKEYVLNLTGKKRIEDIPKEILTIRNSCFATVDEPDKLKDFLKFLFQNKYLQKEVEQVFGEYVVKNLYAIVY